MTTHHTALGPLEPQGLDQIEHIVRYPSRRRMPIAGCILGMPSSRGAPDAVVVVVFVLVGRRGGLGVELERYV